MQQLITAEVKKLNENSVRLGFGQRKGKEKKWSSIKSSILKVHQYVIVW